MVLGWLLLLGWLGGCTRMGPDGAPPPLTRPVIDDPENIRIFFGDGEYRHVVKLHDDGSFLFESGTDFGGIESRRDGRWTWKKTGSHRAELTLGADVWTLTFVSPDSAAAVNLSAPGKTHAFQFERM